MTQGIRIKGHRPRTKKEIREAVAQFPDRVEVESNSIRGQDSYGGLVSEMPMGTEVVFVGPDPGTERMFYGTIKRTARGFKVV